MKTIGLIGGMSWASTVEYYRVINEETMARLGKPHSAKSLIYSVDFAEIEALQRAGRWEEAGRILADAAGRLEAGGADLLVLCTNTMHKIADTITQRVNIPFIHIVDATGAALRAAGITRVGLLATRFTMEEDFYVGRLTKLHGIDVRVPDRPDRDVVHRIIYEELVFNDARAGSKLQFLAIVHRVVEHGAQGVILGCTEIGLLLKQQDCLVPLFDTTRVHALAAVDLALQ